MKSLKNIPSALKVDTIRHISDHGLAVKFTESKLSGMVDFINSRDGVTKLSAGKSEIEITRLGRVTRTNAFFSVGSRHVDAIHYFDADIGANFTVCKQNGTHGENSYGVLNAVIFGAPLPCFFKPRTGAAQDACRAFLVENSWCFTGEAGLRSKALETLEKARLSNVRSAENAADHAKSQLRKLELRTPDAYSAKHTEIREHCSRNLAHLNDRTEKTESCLSYFRAGDFSDAGKFSESAIAAGASGLYHSNGYYFSETYPTVNPPVYTGSYRATITGDKITLSSGIECPFGVQTLLAWLRGETAAPSTRYGVVSKVEKSTWDKKPLVVLKCGCHEIDAAGAFPQLFAELLKPSHTVTTVDGRARVESDKDLPAFVARAVVELTGKLSDTAARRENELSVFAANRKALSDEQASLPARISSAQAEVRALESALDAAKARDAALSKPLGATLEHTSGTAAALVSMLKTLV